MTNGKQWFNTQICSKAVSLLEWNYSICNTKLCFQQHGATLSMHNGKNDGKAPVLLATDQPLMNSSCEWTAVKDFSIFNVFFSMRLAWIYLLYCIFRASYECITLFQQCKMFKYLSSSSFCSLETVHLSTPPNENYNIVCIFFPGIAFTHWSLITWKKCDPPVSG